MSTSSPGEPAGGDPLLNGRPTKQQVYADPTRKPLVFKFRRDDIPQALWVERRWVAWRFVWKANKDGGGKWDKVPFQPDGRHAKSNDPATWVTALDAESAYLTDAFDGVGFVLGDGWVGLDLDNVRDVKTGQIFRPWADMLVRTAGGYADVSPSGTGVKIIGRGVWPAKRNVRRPHPDGGEVEVHVRQYFCVTGRAA